MLLNKAYYSFKFLIPRRLQICLRRHFVRGKLAAHADIWPINPNAAQPRELPGRNPGSAQGGIPPPDAGGPAAPRPQWPDGKTFALVLTHDVENAKSLEQCLQVAALEERLGFRSSFNFVAGDYPLPAALHKRLTDNGHEIGIHGLNHSGNPFRSAAVFRKQAVEINRVLKEWGAVGFRSPSMYHDLEMLHQLDIEYDASTFDTDPFEPQPDGMATIFPFRVPGRDGQKGYVELPYTLPQDFLLFILLRQKSIDIWKRKLDWIVENGGMALFITHPGYMCFDSAGGYDKYPAKLYEEFLEYIKSRYGGQYWHALPRDVARFWAAGNGTAGHGAPEFAAAGPAARPLHPAPARRPIHACMLVYSFYESDNRVMRYAEALARRGDSVDVIALRKAGMPAYEEIRGVRVYRIQKRMIDEKGKISYLLKLIAFLFNSMAFLTKKHLQHPYDLIHVHSVPDFEVFATLFPKLQGARIILDIHDIVPEFYASKFNQDEKTILFKSLVMMERLSSRYADHVIISNHLWEKTLLSRSVERDRCTTILNYPDESLFSPRPRERMDGKFIMIYPGTLGWHQGLDIAVRAFASIREQAPEMEFHIYGRGPEKQNLERLVVELGLGNRVLVKETVPIEQIASIMANADLGVIPKRNDPFGGDAFSTKILEFMSLGVPVIASQTRIDRFYFNDSVVKFFNPEDVDDLAQCMLSLIQDKAERERLRESAWTFVEDYRWEKRKREYLDLVESLTNKKEVSNHIKP